MNTVWGPYYEAYDPNRNLYNLYRMPNPNPIASAATPILKTPVSLLLNELIKPLKMPSTPLPVVSGSPDEGPNRDVIRASIEMMDESIVQKVRAAKNSREALIILALYDLRFGDWADSESSCDGLFNVFKLPVSTSEHQAVAARRERRRAGRKASKERVAVRQYIQDHLEEFRSLLYESRTIIRRKNRKKVAETICLAMYGEDVLKKHPMIQIVLREDYPYKPRSKP